MISLFCCLRRHGSGAPPCSGHCGWNRGRGRLRVIALLEPRPSRVRSSSIPVALRRQVLGWTVTGPERGRLERGDHPQSAPPPVPAAVAGTRWCPRQVPADPGPRSGSGGFRPARRDPTTFSIIALWLWPVQGWGAGEFLRWGTRICSGGRGSERSLRGER
jgi:hypothetical protein